MRTHLETSGDMSGFDDDFGEMVSGKEEKEETVEEISAEDPAAG